MPKKRKRFDESTLDQYLDAHERAMSLVAFYQQVRTARRRAQESEETWVQELEEELVNEYHERTIQLADDFKALAERVPPHSLKAILLALPKEVLEDVLEFQKA